MWRISGDFADNVDIAALNRGRDSAVLRPAFDVAKGGNRRLALCESMLRICLILMLPLSAGCGILPTVGLKPVIRNPFPQLTQVAVAPFFNLSTEPTVDGRQFALAYFNELQLVQGFDVVPVGVVEDTMKANGITLGSPQEARRLAQILGVDAVVVGAVTDFSPYYPPRCGLQIEWYAANPCFHPVPAGYGLPWGTKYEEEIPEPLVFEAAMARARAEYEAISPPYPLDSPPPKAPIHPSEPGKTHLPAPKPSIEATPGGVGQTISYEGVAQTESAACTSPGCVGNHHAGGDLLKEHGCVPTDEPVLQLTKTYNGQELRFTQALAGYYFFQNDARFGGWQGYLQRSDDFIRFCCHVHISELLSARGGASKAEVVWRWPFGR